jgi:hypothetical protein
MQLTQYEEQGYASSIVRLAEMIDREFANG